MYKSQIETPTDSYVARYPWATEMAIGQQDIYWTAEELGVEEDEMDFKTRLTPGELHGVITAQSILTQYELMLGGENLWGGKIPKMFPRPEVARMCAKFTDVELHVHAPFYDIGNKVMGNSTDEFYSQWKRDSVLAERISFIDNYADSDCPLEVTAALALLEGVVLYSAFGFFKGFNSRGFNLIPRFVSGIDASAKDENFHSLASSYLHNECLAERKALGNHTEEDDAHLKGVIWNMAATIYQHEARIVELMFKEGDNRVVTPEELLDFIKDRVNIVLGRLGMAPMFDQEPGLISGWFYNQLNSVKVPDFFAGTQIQYRRNWDRYKLTFRGHNE